MCLEVLNGKQMVAVCFRSTEWRYGLRVVTTRSLLVSFVFKLNVFTEKFNNIKWSEK